MDNCLKIISDLSSLNHVKELSIVYVCVENLQERIFNVDWFKQLKWLEVILSSSFLFKKLNYNENYSYLDNQLIV
jgi:hypothetical protein